MRPGVKADLVGFDPDTMQDKASFEKPLQYAEGVSLVVVSGEIMLDGARLTGSRPGRVLRETYGASEARRWWAYWRVFFLACAELWGWRGGQEWLITHLLFEKPTA